jgi:hypothetical protein
MHREHLEIERLARLLAAHYGTEFDVGYYAEESCGAHVKGTVACSQCGSLTAFEATCTNEIQIDGDTAASLPPKLDDLLRELDLALVALDLARAATSSEAVPSAPFNHPQHPRHQTRIDPQ